MTERMVPFCEPKRVTLKESAKFSRSDDDDPNPNRNFALCFWLTPKGDRDIQITGPHYVRVPR